MCKEAKGYHLLLQLRMYTAFENLTMGDKLALCLAIQVIKEMGFFVLSLHLENYRVEENS